MGAEEWVICIGDETDGWRWRMRMGRWDKWFVLDIEISPVGLLVYDEKRSGS